MVGANGSAEEAGRRIGSVLKGKWTLDRLIGVGGAAAVYEARHRNGSRVAVKVLHARIARSPEQLARFHREGTAANRVGHPGVPAVHDDDIGDDGAPFLVMDLLRGQTVSERAAASGGVLDPREVLEITDRLLDVLVAAHEHDVIHRDIKPQNLFLTDGGELKVLDFGIARLQAPAADVTSTEVGTVLGTPAFLPPEQARGRPEEIDGRSDLWAVGATMHNLLTGRFVHQAPTPNEQLGLAMMAAAPSLAIAGPQLPTLLVALVDRALAYSRDERWPDARAMQAAVRWLREHWAQLGDPTLAKPADWSAPYTTSVSLDAHLVTIGPAVPHPERFRRPAWVLGATLACLAAGVAITLLSTTRPAAPQAAGDRQKMSIPVRNSPEPAPVSAPASAPVPPSPSAAAGKPPAPHVETSSVARPQRRSRPLEPDLLDHPPAPAEAPGVTVESGKRRKAVAELDRRY